MYDGSIWRQSSLGSFPVDSPFGEQHLVRRRGSDGGRLADSSTLWCATRGQLTLGDKMGEIELKKGLNERESNQGGRIIPVDDQKSVWSRDVPTLSPYLVFFPHASAYSAPKEGLKFLSSSVHWYCLTVLKH